MADAPPDAREEGLVPGLACRVGDTRRADSARESMIAGLRDPWKCPYLRSWWPVRSYDQGLYRVG